MRDRGIDTAILICRLTWSSCLSWDTTAPPAPISEISLKVVHECNEHSSCSDVNLPCDSLQRLKHVSKHCRPAVIDFKNIQSQRELSRASKSSSKSRRLLLPDEALVRKDRAATRAGEGETPEWHCYRNDDAEFIAPKGQL